MFNQCLEEESKLITAMGNSFVEKVRYIGRVAQRDVEHEGKGVVNTRDPKINYFLQCKADLDLALPILEKVQKKTLVLQEYCLSRGHCRGLARACQFFDHRFVNRVLLNNCGVDDQEFSDVLEGLARLKDFKSIVYKMNAFQELSLRSLRPLLLKRLPYQLAEIKLIDCQMNGSHICKLMDLLAETNSQLSKLALVNAHQTESSFEKVIGFLKQSEHLRELDLSWSKLPPTSWRKFLAVIAENRQLAALNLSHNKLLEDQPRPTRDMLQAGAKLELSARNAEAVGCFKDFIKYNIHLVTINLENTGLTEPAILFIASLLTKSQALRCLHLCANEGVTPQILAQVHDRIRAKERFPPRAISPYKKHKQEANKVAAPAAKAFGSALIERQRNLTQVAQEHKWHQVREGLKLRSVVNAKRVNDLSTYLGEIDMEGSFLARKMIIQRNLAIRHVMPGSAQWRILTDKRDECWKCGQHVLTIFLWTPRIGTLTCEKDKQKEKYYFDKIEQHRSQDESLAFNASHTPLIAGSFNDWHYERTKEVVPFCMDKDPSPPDFLKRCIEGEELPPECATRKLRRDEEELVAARRRAWYDENWQTVLMSMMSFKKPMVANAHQLTQQSLRVDPTHPVYIHLAWCKPGLHTFAIKHESEDVVSDGEEGQQKAAFSLFMNTKVKQGSKERKTFYVHDMLATFRDEEVPLHFNPRHLVRAKKEKFNERPVFEKWVEDSPDVVKAMLNHDKNRWTLRNACESPAEYMRILDLVVVSYSLLTDVYHFLQARSDRYPWLSAYTVRKHFFKVAVLDGGFGVDQSIFGICFKQVTSKDVQQQEATSVLNRHQFIEFVILIAQYIFKQQSADAMIEGVDIKYTGLSVIKQTQLFLRQTLGKFVESK